MHMRTKNYTLLSFIILSTIFFYLLGCYWNTQYYHGNTQVHHDFTRPLAAAMQGLHDKLYIADIHSLNAEYTLPVISIYDRTASAGAQILASSVAPPVLEAGPAPQQDYVSLSEDPQQFLEYVLAQSAAANASQNAQRTYDFTLATDAYFRDACFIGDSRTVGISEYAGIENATFLCQTSLTIFDYDKPKITYKGNKTSVQEVLSQEQFAKIYLMVGINECGTGTTESFFENYRTVVEDIRRLQPDALIFIEGNLLVTQSKSAESTTVTNANIIERNNAIAALANQKDIFYIDINESTLCENDALVPEYTWDQVHIKAQYYPLWKDFLLEHAIIRGY